MLWIIVLLMCCLPTVESKVCDKMEIIEGRLGKELEFNFSVSDLRDEYDKYISKRDGKKIIQNEIQIQDLRKEFYIKFRNKVASTIEYMIYDNGKTTDLAGNLTEIFMTNDAFVVLKTQLQKEDVGIYWFEFKSIRLGQKALNIAGKPIINGRSPPNPVLKPEENYTSTIQLECHSVSTSIGDCPLPMYTVWYRNGMKITDVDTTLSQLNLKVDLTGGNFTCLATNYLPCYQRVQTSKHFNFLNIEECCNVSVSETFFIKPEQTNNKSQYSVIVRVTGFMMCFVIGCAAVALFRFSCIMHKKYPKSNNSCHSVEVSSVKGFRNDIYELVQFTN